MESSKAAIVVIAAAIIASQSVLAAGKDFEFMALGAEVKSGKDSEFAVRLIHKPTGKPVEGAVIFKTRLDMSPDNMAAMTTTHAAVATSEPGVYRFKADFTMAGNWTFRLQAKVQGESETVESTVVIKAK